MSEAAKIAQRRYQFFAKLKTFRHLQEIYAPGALEELTKDDDDRNPDKITPQAEEVKLWLPSELLSRRRHACKKSVLTKETQLRMAQCNDALKKIRSRLFAKRHLIIWRNTHVRGQRENTRSRGLISTVGNRISLYCKKYNEARIALMALQGVEELPQFPELMQADLTLDVEDVADAAATRKLGETGSTRTRVHAGTGERDKGEPRRMLSWIWTTVGDETDQERVNEGT